MTVTVIVSNWNQLDTLVKTLKSLERQSVKPCEVIIADDGSDDGTLKWFDGLPPGSYPFPLRCTTGPHNGYGLTVSENRAAKVATGALLLFTNADVVHAPGSVAGHAGVPGNRVAGGLVREIAQNVAEAVRVGDLHDWGTFEASIAGNLTDLSNSEYLIRDPAINIYGFWGGNFSVPREAFASVGGFNEGYRGLYGGEESDLIQRLLKKGLHLAWAHRSKVYHLAHNAKEYRGPALGNVKYRMEYL